MKFILFKNKNEKRLIASIAGFFALYLFVKYALWYVFIAAMLLAPIVWLGIIFLALGVCVMAFAGPFKHGILG